VTTDEVIDLLTLIASCDRRTVGKADVAAWTLTVGDLRFADAQEAVVSHYASSREWIMPADIRRRVKAIRSDRISRAVIPAPPAGLADDPGAYRAAMAALERRAGDGEFPEAGPGTLAITGPAPKPQDGGHLNRPLRLGAVLGPLRRQLGPGRRVTHFRGSQDVAAEQVRESRAGREDGTEAAS
jgi:hypothetical protein